MHLQCVVGTTCRRWVPSCPRQGYNYKASPADPIWFRVWGSGFRVCESNSCRVKEPPQIIGTHLFKRSTAASDASAGHLETLKYENAGHTCNRNCLRFRRLQQASEQASTAGQKFMHSYSSRSLLVCMVALLSSSCRYLALLQVTVMRRVTLMTLVAKTATIAAIRMRR